MDNSSINRFEDVEKFVARGDLKEAIRILESCDYDNLKLMKKAKFNVLYSQIKIKIGSYKESLEYAETAIQHSKKLADHYIMIDAIDTKINSLYYLGLFDQGLEEIKNGEKLLLTHKLPQERPWMKRKASLLNLKGKILEKKGEENAALKSYNKSLVLYEKLEDKGCISSVLNNIGIIYRKKGDLDKALDYYQHSLKLRERLGDKTDIVASLNNIGIVYEYKGDLNRALKYYKKALELVKETGNKQYIAAIINNVGNIYFEKGELDQALEYYMQSMNLWGELGHKQYNAYCINHQGKVYRRKGNLKRALEQYKKALEILKQINNNFDISITLFDLITVSLDSNDHTLAEKFFLELEKISSIADNKVIDQRYRVAKALILKKKSRVRMKAKAEDILDLIVKEPIVDHELTVIAMLNLCDLLLGELRISNNAEILKEVQFLVNDLIEIAKQQHSHWLIAETYFLKAKLFLLELNIEKARHFLIQAQLIAEERGMMALAIKISNEHDQLLIQSLKWQSLILKNASLAERMDLAELETTIERLLQMKITDTPKIGKDDPVLFLILSKAGLTLFSKPFLPEGEFNPQLLGAFLTAIRGFSDAVFSRSLDRALLGEYTLVMQSKEPLLMCYVFKGHAFSAIKKVNRFIQTVINSKNEWNALMDTNWSGVGLNDTRYKSLTKITEEIFL